MKYFRQLISMSIILRSNVQDKNFTHVFGVFLLKQCMLPCICTFFILRSLNFITYTRVCIWELHKLLLFIWWNFRYFNFLFSWGLNEFYRRLCIEPFKQNVAINHRPNIVTVRHFWYNLKAIHTLFWKKIYVSFIAEINSLNKHDLQP